MRLKNALLSGWLQYWEEFEHFIIQQKMKRLNWLKAWALIGESSGGDYIIQVGEGFHIDLSLKPL